MIQRTAQKLQEFFNAFTTGMTRDEFQRLFNVDARDMYAFYVRNMKQAPQRGRGFARFLAFCWNFFIAFLLKLSPARRLLYALAILFFVMFLMDTTSHYDVYSFLLFNFLLMMEVADKMMTRDELSVAREIQLSLLPQELKVPHGYTMAAHSEVARNVGGDYHDLLTLEDGSSLLVVGDVAGKGISAALYMVKTQTALHMLMQKTSDPVELLARLDTYLRGQLKKNFFITLSLVHFRGDGTLRYYRAGHTPALVYRKSTMGCEWLKPKGCAVGLSMSAQGENGNGNGGNGGCCLEPMDVDIQTGDALLLYTDGVEEAVNAWGEEYGQARLVQFAARHAALVPEEFRQRLASELKSFNTGAELRDDITFVILQRTPEAAD